MTVDEIRAFIVTPQINDSIMQMEISLDKANGYSQYIGELQNHVEQQLSEEKQAAVEKFAYDDTMTETLRKTKIEAATAPTKRSLQDLKLLSRSLKQCSMSLMQAIRTRREEPR